MVRLLSPLRVPDGDRQALAYMSRWGTRKERTRARLVLLAADGVPNRHIAKIVDLNPNQVGMWRKRYADRGIAGLRDLPRSGRPRRAQFDGGLS